MKNNMIRQRGFTMMELIITVGIMVIVSMFIHQIFFSSTDAVKLGLATSGVMSKGAAVQNQLTYDTQRDLLLGPSEKGEPGGFLVIINHELPAYIRDDQAMRDNQDIRPAGAKPKTDGITVIKKFRSDQIIFFRKTRKGERPITSPDGNTYSNINTEEEGYARIWYGHLKRTLPDGDGDNVDPFGTIPGSKIQTGYNGLANEWILGRQAMYLYKQRSDLPPDRYNPADPSIGIRSEGQQAYFQSFDGNTPKMEDNTDDVYDNLAANVSPGATVPRGLFYPSNPELVGLPGSVSTKITRTQFPYYAYYGMAYAMTIANITNVDKPYNYAGYNDVALTNLLNEPYAEYILDTTNYEGVRFKVPLYGSSIPFSRMKSTWNNYAVPYNGSYGLDAIRCGYVDENPNDNFDPRLWVNPTPSVNNTADTTYDFAPNKISQQHAYLCGNVSDFIVEFAADTDNDGVIDRDTQGNIQWYGLPRSVGGMERLSGGSVSASGAPFNRMVKWPDHYNDSNFWQWPNAINNCPKTYFNFKQPATNMPAAPDQRRAAFVFRHDDGMPFIAGGDGRNCNWPYMIRVRYRIQDPRGRLQTQSEVSSYDVNEADVLYPSESEPGKWFEKIIWVKRPRNWQ